jgi:Icc-related predicted phosphoesterase
LVHINFNIKHIGNTANNLHIPNKKKEKMKFLAFTDSHLNKDAITRILDTSKNVDFLICAGDISWFSVGLEKVLQLFEKKLDKPLYIIPGNHEEEKKLEIICKKFSKINPMHKKTLKINNWTFFFWGGGGFTPFDEKLENEIKKFKETLSKDDKVILVTHGPPYNTELDYLEWAGHVGCRSQKKFLTEIKPILHICGHLHENFNKQQVYNKRTLIINPGPAGMILEL